LDKINLQAQRPRKYPLDWEDGVFLAARDHCLDQGSQGLVGHYGSDNSSPFDRMDRFGTAYGLKAENIAYGREIAFDIVLDMFIDDGVVGRGHRLNLWGEAFGVTGVNICPHTDYEFMTVVLYAGDYEINEYG
jgi:uncharacterized protein YkwD